MKELLILCLVASGGLGYQSYKQNLRISEMQLELQAKDQQLAEFKKAPRQPRAGWFQERTSERPPLESTPGLSQPTRYSTENPGTARVVYPR